jgi:hypothetical protein
MWPNDQKQQGRDKGKDVPVHAKKAYVEVEVQVYSFLISISIRSCFTPRIIYTSQ